MNITYSNEQKKVKIPKTAEKLLLAALEAVGELHALSANTEVDVTIVTDKEIHKINKAYRNVDRPTDVLSFAFDETDGEEPELLGNLKIHLLGNIIISAETALRQGKEYGHGISRELAYLAVHGCLHLLGYDHMIAKDKAVMRKQEELALKKIKLSQEDLDTPAMDKRVQKKLWRLAVKAREYAYAPYSKFKVGAAVLTADGKIFTGCNVENASYGLTCCAERNTMFAAVGEGAREFTCLCVVADTKEPVLPCGACLQVLAEFKVAQILLANCAGELKLVKLADLLPYGFGKAALQPSKKNKKA